MDTVSIGKRAETAALRYLYRHGYTPICRNWRRPMCEIDLVVGKDRTIFFVEVKYRSQRRQGSGFDYVGPAKLHHMRRAAELWVSVYRWRGRYELGVIEIGGPSFDVTAMALFT